MVDPFVLDYQDASISELEEFMLFCIAVAGKNAVTTARLLDSFLSSYVPIRWESPFEYIRAHRNLKTLGRLMCFHGFGCWRMKSRGFWEIARSGIDLRTADTDELEGIYGIGPKTSRFFVLHTQPNARCACLDTHILKFLRDQGHDAPKITPSSKRQYRFLEGLFLKECDKRKVDPKTFDLKIWTKYTKNKKEDLHVSSYNSK